ncbi:hypothetical protein, partial [Staphylococcus aureus]
MKHGFEVLESELSQKIVNVSQRVDALERNQIINDWFHTATAQGLASNPYQTLLNLTSSFYVTSGRTWETNELARYINALKLLKLDEEELVPATLILQSQECNLIDNVEGEYILPIASSKQNDYPL